MKIIIAWAGGRSKAIVGIFRWWIPLCLQGAETWISESDTDKGKRWRRELAGQLAESNFGLACLTPEDLDERWINFEAGALSKLEEAYLWTYLHELKPTDITGPLEDFQHSQFSKEEIRRLMHAINNAASERKLSEIPFNETFEIWWPKLEQRLRNEVPAPPDRRSQRGRSMK